MRERVVGIPSEVIRKVTACVDRPLNFLAHRLAHYAIEHILRGVAEKLRQDRLSGLQIERENAEDVERNHILPGVSNF